MSSFRGTERFEKVRRLGAGGMGVVYEVYDRDREMRVALKTLRDMEPTALYRFKREFRVLADISHPNLVTLYELISDEGLWFFTMELIDGTDLLTHVSTRPPGRVGQTVGTEDPTLVGGAGRLRPLYDLRRLISSLLQLVRALGALHRSERVHRDIKPSNAMVARDGRVVLLDFGIVTDISGDTRQSTDAQLLGTTAYMAPEQVEGRRASPAADWYSLGAVLYEALTGRVPFEGPTYKALMAKLTGEPAPPSALKLPAPVDPELELLCLDLLQRDPDARPGYDEILTRLGAPQESTSERLHSPESSGRSSFVGRKAELRLLEQALLDSREEEGVGVLVGGRSGIGKTRMVRHVVETWRRAPPAGLPAPLVLSGRCYVRENVPYKAFDGIVDALSHALLLMPRQERRQRVPADTHQLARLFPVLQRVPGVADSPRHRPTILDPQERRARAFEVLRELLSRLSTDRPVVLVLDDLQWADADSMELLADLWRPPGLPRLLLIACFREEEVESAPLLRAFLARVSERADVRRLPLGPLTSDESAQLARRLLRRGGFNPDAPGLAVSKLADETGGSPLFVGELCRYAMARAAAATGERSSERASTDGELARSLPASGDLSVTFESVLRARMRRLPDVAEDLVKLLAVSGEPLPREVLASAIERHPRELERAIARLRVESLIREVGTGSEQRLDVHHDRIREVILAEMAGDDDRSRHRRLAAALERWERAPVAALARHWQAAGEEHRAGEYAQDAAVQAAENLAFERAATLYQMALRYTDPEGPRSQELLESMGDCLVNAGRGAEAAEAYLAAAEGPSEGPCLRLRRQGAEQLLKTGYIERGLKVTAEVLAAHGLKLPRSTGTAIATILWYRARVRLGGFRWTERSVEEIPPREIETLDALWSAACGLAMLDPIKCTAMGVQVLHRTLQIGLPRRVAIAFISEAMMLASQLGRRTPVTRDLERQAIQLAHRLEDPYVLAFVDLQRGIAALHVGEWATCLDLLLGAEKRFVDECQGVSWELVLCREYILYSLVEQGRLDELGNRMHTYLRDAELRKDRFAEGIVKCRFTHVWLARDDVAGARALLDGVLETWPEGWITLQHYHVLLSQVDQCLYAGDSVGAGELLDREWPTIRTAPNARIPIARLDMQFLRARVALARAVADVDREANLARARRLARRMTDRFPHAGAFRGQILAGADRLGGDAGSALSRAEEAEAGYRAADMSVHAAVIRMARGQLLGGDEGQALLDAGRDEMTRVGVIRPGRIAAVYAPGLVDP